MHTLPAAASSEFLPGTSPIVPIVDTFGDHPLSCNCALGCARMQLWHNHLVQMWLLICRAAGVPFAAELHGVVADSNKRPGRSLVRVRVTEAEGLDKGYRLARGREMRDKGGVDLSGLIRQCVLWDVGEERPGKSGPYAGRGVTSGLWAATLSIVRVMGSIRVRRQAT